MTTKEVLKLNSIICFVLLASVPICSLAWTAPDAQFIVEKMQTSYADVNDYQTNLVITGFGKDEVFKETHRLLYTFKRPNKMRLDFEHPHRGMLVTYPDKNGKVVVRPTKALSFWKYHLDPESSFLEVSPGQPINRTDLGVLIRNIEHSVTDLFLGDLQVAEDHEHVAIHVLSDNPFRRGVATRYAFLVSKELWLPVSVEELSPSKVLRRKVIYENLRLNVGVSDSFFRPN